MILQLKILEILYLLASFIPFGLLIFSKVFLLQIFLTLIFMYNKSNL